MDLEAGTRSSFSINCKKELTLDHNGFSIIHPQKKGGQMSIECLNAALKVEGLPTSSKFVLVVLSNYADERSTCYPSHSHIGKIVGIKDRKHIGKIIKQLEFLGYLKVNKRYRDDGRINHSPTLK